MAHFANDQIQASGISLSAQCCLILHKLMEINPKDAVIQERFQKQIDLLFEIFPKSLPCPKVSLTEEGNGHY